MIFPLREWRVKFNVFFGLSDGVMVTQRPLEALFMVRIHVGQPIWIFLRTSLKVRKFINFQNQFPGKTLI